MNMNDSYYTPPQVPPQEPKKPASAIEIVTLVLGILALVCSCCCGFASIPFGIGAIVCAIVSRSQNGKMGGMALTGLIMGIAALVLGIVGTLLTMVFYTGFSEGMIGELEQYMDGYSYYGY